MATSKKNKASSSSSDQKRSPNPAFMKPVKPDTQLSAVVGNEPIPRTEVTKRMWDYIKKNNLQDPADRRMINADDRLKPIFGGRDQVSMFEMTKLMNEHVS
jgi:upstream activation factor subunit UAF30